MSLEDILNFGKRLSFESLILGSLFWFMLLSFTCTKNPVGPSTDFYKTYETYSSKTDKEGKIKFKSSMLGREVVINVINPHENKKPLENIVVNFYNDDKNMIATSHDPASKYLPSISNSEQVSLEKGSNDSNPVSLTIASFPYELYKKGVFAFRHMETIFPADEDYIINFPGVIKRGKWSFEELRSGAKLFDKASSLFLTLLGHDTNGVSSYNVTSMATPPTGVIFDYINEIIGGINKLGHFYISKNKKYEFYEIPGLNFTFALPIKGDDAIQITNDKSEDFLPAWSPDGKSIVFTSNRSEWLGSLYITDYPGVNTRRLTKDNCQNFPSDWTLDDKIIFKSFDNFGGGNNYIKEISPNGSDYKIIKKISEGTTGSTKLLGIKCSHNGVYIAYISKEGANGQVCITDRLGESKRVLTSFTNDCHYPSWSWDDRFICTESGGFLYRVDVRTSNILGYIVRHGEAYEADLFNSDPIDFTKVVFSSYSDYTDSYDLFIRSSKYGVSTNIRLTYDPADDMQPRVSPDGKKIAFTSKRKGNEDVWVIDVDEDLQ